MKHVKTISRGVIVGFISAAVGTYLGYEISDQNYWLVFGACMASGITWDMLS